MYKICQLKKLKNTYKFDELSRQNGSIFKVLFKIFLKSVKIVTKKLVIKLKMKVVTTASGLID